MVLSRLKKNCLCIYDIKGSNLLSNGFHSLVTLTQYPSIPLLKIIILPQSENIFCCTSEKIKDTTEFLWPHQQPCPRNESPSDTVHFVTMGRGRERERCTLEWIIYPYNIIITRVKDTM